MVLFFHLSCSWCPSWVDPSPCWFSCSFHNHSLWLSTVTCLIWSSPLFSLLWRLTFTIPCCIIVAWLVPSWCLSHVIWLCSGISLIFLDLRVSTEGLHWAGLSCFLWFQLCVIITGVLFTECIEAHWTRCSLSQLTCTAVHSQVPSAAVPSEVLQLTPQWSSACPWPLLVLSSGAFIDLFFEFFSPSSWLPYAAVSPLLVFLSSNPLSFLFAPSVWRWAISMIIVCWGALSSQSR